MLECGLRPIAQYSILQHSNTPFSPNEGTPCTKNYSASFLLDTPALPFSARAQQPKKVYRIGYLSPVDAATDTPVPTEFGWLCASLAKEGQNIAIEYRYAEGRPDRESGLAAELVRLKVEYHRGSVRGPVDRAAKKATKTIPSLWRHKDPTLLGQAC